MFKTLDLKKDIMAKQEEISGLRMELNELKARKETDEQERSKRAKMEDERIKHLVKMKEERLEVDYEKKCAALEKEKAKAIAECKDQYRDKLETFLRAQIGDMKDMQAEILKRLPDVNVRLKG